MLSKAPTVKKFDLNIEKILENWDVHDAVREVIANAIDEGILTGKDKLDISKDWKGAWHIRDYGRGLRHEHLTQKEDEEKLRNPNVIGKFGIGLKDALATFNREGVKVLIKSKYGDITLGESVKHDFEDVTTLHAFITPPSDLKMEGTEFILSNCDDKEIERAKNLFLRFSGEKVLEKNQYGEVLEKRGEPARIYINGVKCADEDRFLFSYNITSLTSAIRKALNRERTNVGRTAYSERVKSILLSCKDKEVARRLVDDLKGFETGTIHDELKWDDVSVYASKLLSSEEKTVFFTPQELASAPNMVDRVKRDGYEIVTVSTIIRDKISGQMDVSGNIIRDLGQFNKEWNSSFKFKCIAESQLTDKERRIYRLTPKILDFVGGQPREVKDIKVSETMRIDTQTFMESTGLWEESDGRIIIKRSQLRDLKDYAGTLLHEIAHAKSRSPDVNRNFESQLTSLIGEIVSKLIKE